MTTCPHCGGDVAQSGRGRPRRFCTFACAKAWHNDERARLLVSSAPKRRCCVCNGPIPFGKPGVKYVQKTCSSACESRRHVSRRGRCPQCRRWVYQRRTSRRIYCSSRCRTAAFYERNPGYGYTPAPPVEPFPLPYTGHEWFVIARQAAGISGGYSGGASGLTHHQVDWGQHDILAEAVLAIAEGRDPKEAVRKQRALDKADRLRREWGVLDFGQDDNGNIITVKDHDGD